MAKRPTPPLKLSAAQHDALLDTLCARFEAHAERHRGLVWAKVAAQLKAHPDKLWSLNEMERTGGEPDVVAQDKRTGAYVFYDCAAQTPEGRRNVCYDRDARVGRTKFPPKNSAMEMADAMGVELLTEGEYCALQQLGEFDTTRSSWLATPEKVRALGGALFGDRRFDTVFVYHNGADSYYAGRGFRASLVV